MNFDDFFIKISQLVYYYWPTKRKILSINREVKNYLSDYAILAEIFSKKYVYNFFQRVNNHYKSKMIICKRYKYKSKKINKFFQSQKIDLIYK